MRAAMRPWCAHVTLLLAVVARGWAQDTEEESSDLPKLTCGIFLQGVGRNALSYETSDGHWTGFEVELLKQLLLVELADYDVSMIRLPTYDSRIDALQNHTVDFVLGLFAVTPARKKLIDFVKPYYYSSGTSVFGPGDGCPEGVESWADLNGTRLVMRQGFYSNEQILALGVIPVWSELSSDAGKLVANGSAEGMIDDAFYDHSPENLTLCTKLGMQWHVAAGIGVPKNSTEMYEVLSEAMMRMVEGGQNAIILQIENATMVASGYPPEQDLQELVANPYGDTFLNPAED